MINNVNLLKTKRIWTVMGLVFTFGIICSGCSKNSEVKSSQYYVKYEVKSSTIYIGGKLNVEITTENNKKTTILIPTRTPWETVVGPVKKGFKASLKVNDTGNNFGHLKLYTQISVSKEDSPFALKKIDSSDEPRTSVETNYTID